jgi:hypothetical protein
LIFRIVRLKNLSASFSHGNGFGCCCATASVAYAPKAMAPKIREAILVRIFHI